MFRIRWIALLTGTLSKTVAIAGLLAYEGFNYPVGTSFSGTTGGLGWSNAWVDVSGNQGQAITGGSLFIGPGSPSGFASRSTGNSALINSNSRGGRWLNCAPGGPFALAGLVNANGKIGADNKSVYLSFLQQPDAPGKFYEFELHRNDLGDNGRLAGIGNDSPDNNAYFRSRSLPGGAFTFWNAGPGSTNVNLHVLRIDFKPGNDDVYLYRNPTGDFESDNEPVLTLIKNSDMSFDGIALGAYSNSRTVRHDEIRIGTTWSSVLGDPPAFIAQPSSKLCYAGQMVSLDSLAQSSLSLTYRWYRIRDGITNEITGENSQSLRFSSVQMGQAGQYFATASNRLGIATSSLAQLTVQPINIALNNLATVETTPDGRLELSSIVVGAEPMSLQWYKDGHPVEGATMPAFIVEHADVFDPGQYFLIASNLYGSVTSSVVNVSSSARALLAYEGFADSASGGDVANNGGGFGWGGTWQDLGGGPSQSFASSLVGGTDVPLGYDASSSGGSLLVADNSRKGRLLDCSRDGIFAQHGYLSANGLVGADIKTLYLSFLQQPNGSSKFYELELHRGDLGDAGRIGGIGNDAEGTSVNFRVQSPPGGPSTFWNLGPGTTNVGFYVVRFDFKPGNDDVFIYRNPTSATEPAAPTLVLSNTADLSFDGISLAAYLNNRTVTHDEIRIGKSWGDVIGQQTPSQLRLARPTVESTELSLAGMPNFNYQVQAANALEGPWTNIGNIGASPLGVGEFVETASAGQRFYRATNALSWLAALSSDVLIADFESETYGSWIATGTAFGSGPAQGTLPTQQMVSGYQGSRLVNSFLGGDTTVGTLSSPPFVITKPYINFLVGGGALPGAECINLIVSNSIVRTATGANTEALAAQQWVVTDFLGQTATLQILDSATGSWGHINVDQITFSDTPFPSLSRTVLLTEQLLNLPVRTGAAMRRVTVSVDGKPVRDFDIELADAAPDWWAYTDISAFSNKTATISVNSLPAGSLGLTAIVQTNGIVGATNLYRESLRSQFHFSSQRGWLNDANAMFYHNGQYHLYYQHNPYGWSWGNMHWGHAVSSDMVNWKQMPVGIYPHTYGDMVYSGSAVVDQANTGGFKSGTNDVIVAAYTSTGRGECIAFSNDGGLTFTDYVNNPVVVHNGRDPRLLWYAPSNHWVMAVYSSDGGDGISFYTSPNLRQWTYRSKINGFFECPDLFQLPVDGNTNNMLWLLCDASSGYQLGQFDGSTFTPATAKLPGNGGAAFYASQTFSSMAPGDNRTVRIGWAQISTPGMPFNQLMYFPTELNLRTTSTGVRLCSTPIAEIGNNVASTYSWTNLTLSAGSNPLSGIRGTLFYITAQFSIGTAQSIQFNFQGVTVTYNALTQEISCNGRKSVLAPYEGKVQLEMIVDRNTIEIFGNNGELYMPLPVSNPAGNALISLTCDGGNASLSSLTVNKLKSIWTGSTR